MLFCISVNTYLYQIVVLVSFNIPGGLTDLLPTIADFGGVILEGFSVFFFFFADVPSTLSGK